LFSWSYYTTRVRRTLEKDQTKRFVTIAAQSAVVIFSLSSTSCMCHAMKSLFSGMGVTAMVHELDQDSKAFMRLLGNSTSLPVVFIGGGKQFWLFISMVLLFLFSNMP
ncbi:hypothetical protein RYX36_011113, partial [Vicia faba]